MVEINKIDEYSQFGLEADNTQSWRKCVLMTLLDVVKDLIEHLPSVSTTFHKVTKYRVCALLLVAFSRGWGDLLTLLLFHEITHLATPFFSFFPIHLSFVLFSFFIQQEI